MRDKLVGGLRLKFNIIGKVHIRDLITILPKEGERSSDRRNKLEEGLPVRRRGPDAHKKNRDGTPFKEHNISDPAVVK